MNAQMLPLKEAAEKFQSADIIKFRNGMKKAKCLIKVAGVEMVNLVKLQETATEMSQSNGKGQKKTRPTNPVGLLKARLKMYPSWIDGKKEAIEAMRIEMGGASNPYEKHQSRKKLEKLQKDLAQMEGNSKRDEKKLDDILNGDYGQGTADEQVEAS